MGSLAHSQEPATCPYPESHQCILSPLSTSLHILILFSHLKSMASSLSTSIKFTHQDTIYITPVHHTCHMPNSSPFLSFGDLNNIQLAVRTINLLTNQHLPLVLPVCPLSQTTCTYNVHCATGSTLPLAMSTQSVDRAADGTAVCRSVVSVICEWIDWFDSNSVMGAV